MLHYSDKGVLPISGTDVSVYIASSHKRNTHAGAYVVDNETWGFDLARYAPHHHPCGQKKTSVSRCEAMTLLTTVGMALDNLAYGSSMVLHISNQEVASILGDWRNGMDTMPNWRLLAGDSAKLLKLRRSVLEDPNRLLEKYIEDIQGTWQNETAQCICRMVVNCSSRYSLAPDVIANINSRLTGMFSRADD